MESNFKVEINNNPLISIIVPVYKVEKYLSRCIESILNQTYKNIEIILVDDGSPDNCPQICDVYSKIDSRIKVIHKENGGLSKARNTGLDIATGEYIAFVDSDDYIEEDMYEVMLSKLKENNADICVCQWQYEYSDGKQVVDLNNVDSSIYGKLSSILFAEFLYKGQYENGVVCAMWNKLYKKKIFDNIRFEGTYAEDDCIQNYILSNDYLIYVIKNQFYIYCQNNDSLTNSNFSEKNLCIFEILENRISIFRRNKFIVKKSKKLYCELYIEYYYKCIKYNLNMPKKELYNRYLNELIKEKVLPLKTIIRMLIFNFSPKLYLHIIRIK